MAMALISCLQLRRARRREREADVAAQDTRAAARRRRAAAHIGVGPRVDTPNFFSSAAAVASGEKVEEWLDEDGGRGNQRTWPGYRSQSRLGMQSDDKKDAPRWRESVVEVESMDMSDMDPESRGPSRGPSRGTIRWA